MFVCNRLHPQYEGLASTSQLAAGGVGEHDGVGGPQSVSPRAGLAEQARAPAETERSTAENTAARVDAHLDAAQHRVAELTGEREQLSANLSAAIERAIRRNRRSTTIRPDLPS
jgi:hypothetical protein